jgi:hypothetical protein
MNETTTERSTMYDEREIDWQAAERLAATDRFNDPVASWDSESRQSPYSTVCDPHDEHCDDCDASDGEFCAECAEYLGKLADERQEGKAKF